jgi:hypothetical protein
MKNKFTRMPAAAALALLCLSSPIFARPTQPAPEPGRPRIVRIIDDVKRLLTAVATGDLLTGPKP